MEVLKDFESLFEVDERWKFFGRGDSSYLKELHTEVKSIGLILEVPEDVVSQFNVAKMLAVYAWSYFPLHQAAEMKAFSTLEMALRFKLAQNKRMTFKELLDKAVENGYLKDDIFSELSSLRNVKDYSAKLPKLVSSMRNGLAHGGTSLNHGSVFTLRHCATIINSLFS
jgi:hypothetical protein